MAVERELTSPVELCDASGRLNPEAVGWSHHPLHTCNLRGPWPRQKRWDYWCVTSDTHPFSVTLSNLDYAGLAFVYCLDFGTRRFIEKTVIRPFASGCALGPTVGRPARFVFRGLSLPPSA